MTCGIMMTALGYYGEICRIMMRDGEQRNEKGKERE